jgi:hypothetical protein
MDGSSLLRVLRVATSYPSRRHSALLGKLLACHLLFVSTRLDTESEPTLLPW